MIVSLVISDFVDVILPRTIHGPVSDMLGLLEVLCGFSWNNIDTASWLTLIPNKVVSSWAKFSKAAVVKFCTEV